MLLKTKVSRQLDRSMELVRCSTIDNEGKSSTKEGKSIVLLGMSYNSFYCNGDDSWFLSVIPGSCLYNCNQPQENTRKRKRNIDLILNHSYHDTSPTTNTQPIITIPKKFKGLFYASYAVLGSILYFFCSHRKKGGFTKTIYCLNLSTVDITDDNLGNLNFNKAGSMVNKMYDLMVVALEGKIYVFGNNENGVCAEVFEPYPGRIEGLSKSLTSLSSVSGIIYMAFAIQNQRKIVVAYDDRRHGKYLYDVEEDSWVEFHIDTVIFFRSRFSRPINVGSCMYWVACEIHAYDLETKFLYQGPVQDFLIQNLLETPHTSYYPDDFKVYLSHFEGDFFRLIWIERCKSDTLHCTTIKILKTTTKLSENCYKLQVTVISCQRFPFGFPLFLQILQ